MSNTARANRFLDPENLTSREAGQLFRVSGSAVRKWHSRMGAPRNTTGSYNLAHLIRWREQRLREKDDELQESPGSPALERGRSARAQLAELDLGERQGLLLSKTEVERREVQIATAFRIALENWPAEMAPRLEDRPALEIEEELEVSVRGVLTQLAQQ